MSIVGSFQKRYPRNLEHLMLNLHCSGLPCYANLKTNTMAMRLLTRACAARIWTARAIF